MSGRKIVGFLLATLIAAVYATSNIWYGSRPDYETAVEQRPASIFCGAESCVGTFTLVLGNTGLKTQENIEIVLFGSAVESAELKPKIRSSGKIDRRVVPHLSETEASYQTGPIKAGHNVELSLSYVRKTREEIPSWSEVLVGVHPNQGKVISGSGEAITFGRIITNILRTIF